jgi:membrane protein
MVQDDEEQYVEGERADDDGAPSPQVRPRNPDPRYITPCHPHSRPVSRLEPRTETPESARAYRPGHGTPSREHAAHSEHGSAELKPAARDALRCPRLALLGIRLDGAVEPSEVDRSPNETLAGQLAVLASSPTRDTRLGRARSNAIVVAQRATSWGPFAPVAEAGWRTLRRDSSIGGGVLGAALAYRLFIWLLPLALVLVIGLGWTTGDPTRVVRNAGLTGFIANSVATSSDHPGGLGAVVAFVAVLVVFLYQTFALLQAVRAVTALAWGLPVQPLSRPARSTFLFLLWILALVAVTAAATPFRTALAYPWDLVSALAVCLALPALYFALARWLLPHPAVHWSRLIPGSILFGIAIAFIGLFNSLILFPWLQQRQATYGVLGLAAGLLFGLFLLGRTFEVAAALNATRAADRRRNVQA